MVNYSKLREIHVGAGSKPAPLGITPHFGVGTMVQGGFGTRPYVVVAGVLGVAQRSGRV